MKATSAQTRVEFQNILFATDFSPAAIRAAPFVKRIARHYDANLLILHVRAPVVSTVNVPGAWPIDVQLEAGQEDQYRTNLLETFAGIRTKVLIETGDILSSLQEAIQGNNTDLVVVGTRGRTGLGKLVLGSISEEVFRTVTCPVLTVGPHSDATRGADGQIREILYPTDFRADSQGAATYAVSLAEEFQARLILLHVIREPEPGDLVFVHKAMEAAQELLRKLVPPGAEAWCKPECLVERGDPAEKILEIAKLRESDLIVLAVRPETGVPGAAIHLPIATAHKVVSHATCPVLTIRS